MFNPWHNANNIIAYKLALFIYKSGFNFFDRDLKYCLQRCQPASLSTEKQFHVKFREK